MEETKNYSDVIHHSTTTTFSFYDRIKILFGRKVIIMSDIYTRQQVDVIGSSARTSVEPLIKHKKIGGLHDCNEA